MNTKEILDFFSRLRDNNDREWFNLHRAEWQAVKAGFAGFVEQLIEGIASFDSSVAGLRVQDCTYRIARDTRFSPDKTPYKSHIGAYIAPHGKQSGYAGYYFHIEPVGEGLLGGSLLASGLYCPDPVVLKSVREEIFDNGDAFNENIRSAKGFYLDSANCLKRTPVGFPSGTAHDDLLRHKDFLLECTLNERELLASDLLERTVEAFKKTSPFVATLNKAVQYAFEEMK